MKLNIYEKKQVVKTYETDAYDLMFGTCEDVAKAVDLDSLKTGSDIEIIKLVGNFVVSNMEVVKDFLKDIFDGLTDEELRRTKVNEIAIVFIEVVQHTITQLGTGSERKN